MKYETQPDGHLRITIQPEHRLWKIFREGYDRVIIYNLQGKGEDPVVLATQQLFPGYIGSEIERRVRDRWEIRTSKLADLKWYKVSTDIDALCRYVIRDYLCQKLMIAQNKLNERALELTRQVVKKTDKQPQKTMKTVAMFFDEATSILAKTPGAFNYSILFEGAEGVEPYVFDSREDPFVRALEHLQR